MSEAYLSGLPLELGRLAHDVHDRRLRALKKLLVGDHRLPLAGELIEGLKGTLGSFAADTRTVGDGWKQRVDLTAVELDRQARIIDDLLGRRNVAAALGLMNEWDGIVGRLATGGRPRVARLRQHEAQGRSPAGRDGGRQQRCGTSQPPH